MGLCHRRKEKYNSRGYRFLMFTGISAGILPLYPRGGGVRPATGISAGNLSMYPRGGVFPPGHGYIRGKSSPVPARWCFSAQPRVYSREILSCTRAVVFFRQTTGISAGNLLLYPHGGVFLPGHGYIRGKSFPVPARRGFSARPRVYSREIFPCTRAVAQKKPPYRRMRRIVRYDGSVIIIIIWQRLPQPQALRPLEVLLLPRMSVQGKVL